MELKAQYDLDDLLDLVEQDLTGKGFRLVGGLEPVLDCGPGRLVLTLAIEQFKEIVPGAPVIEATQAPAANSKKVKGVSSVGKTEEQLAKQRVYRKRHEEKKKREIAENARQAAAEIPPVLGGDDRPIGQWEKDFHEKLLVEINELKQSQEVVAPSTVPFQVLSEYQNSGLLNR